MRKSKHGRSREKSVFELVGEAARLTEKNEDEKQVDWTEVPGARVRNLNRPRDAAQARGTPWCACAGV